MNLFSSSSLAALGTVRFPVIGCWDAVHLDRKEPDEKRVHASKQRYPLFLLDNIPGFR